MSPARKTEPKPVVKPRGSRPPENHLPLAPEAPQIPDLTKGKGGRPRAFDRETVRLNLFLPEETAKRIRILAVEQGVSPSQLVDGWANRAVSSRNIGILAFGN